MKFFFICPHTHIQLVMFIYDINIPHNFDHYVKLSRKKWGICCTPHLTGKCGTRPFFGGSGRRAVAHTRPARSGGTHGVLTKVHNCYLVVSYFELYSCYYIYFHTNTLRKGMNSLVLPPAMR